MTDQELYKKIQDEKLVLCTDTREMKEGCFFAAIRGENFDGNSYAEEALNKGASFALVDDSRLADKPNMILVDSVVLTLQRIAQIHRKTFNIPVIAIGGSNGKTTTRHLTCAVLKKKYKVHQPIKNFNNHIGIPIVVLSMPRDTEIAVFELGANRVGEHSELLPIIEPTHVLVTNNGEDHLEGFGSIENVRKANKEIYDWAIEYNAKIFVNKDLSDLMEDSSSGRQITYSTSELQTFPGEYADIEYKGKRVRSQLYGSYNVLNIAAAICIGEEFGVETQDITEAIESFIPETNRSKIITKDGIKFILDCYNANPSSMEIALHDLFKMQSQKTIILGDMLELGKYSKDAHKRILDFVQDNIFEKDHVICVGEEFGVWSDDFNFDFVSDVSEAKHTFETLDQENKIVFLKGSRGIALEKIVQ